MIGGLLYGAVFFLGLAFPLSAFIWWDYHRPESVEARARVARINAEYERVFGD